MQEVKKPKKTLIYYYVIVLAVLFLFNFLFMPWAAERQVKEVGYDTFMKMTEKEQIGQVQIDQEENEILFTDKDGTEIYKTGMELGGGVLRTDHQTDVPDPFYYPLVDPADRYLHRPGTVYVQKTDE